MKKWLIIDGYNLLHNVAFLSQHKSKKLEESRDMLIKEVSELAYLLAEKVTIVFDGRSSYKKDKTEQETIEIIFASPSTTADTIIIQLVKEYQDPRNVAVVSSDKIIVENATSLGAELMSTNFFIEWLKNARENLTAHLNRQATKRVIFTLSDVFSKIEKIEKHR